MISNKDYKTLKKFLIRLGFKNSISSGNTHTWEQPTKSISFKINLSTNKKNYLRQTVEFFLKLVEENFTPKELHNFLIPFFKDNKIRFNKKSQTKILKMDANCEQGLESKILYYLLPEKKGMDFYEYTTPIEFTDQLRSNIKTKFLKNIDEEIKDKIKIRD